ncbi:MAG: zf-HC2 domain-containing protein [Candidatus Aminicenantes bacterium]|nr:zf-HC2 domain-containing protein [Candidatus Aminicenantes bacterium]
MTCRKAKKLMPLYAGGDLRPRLTAAVLAHVDSCPSCREELAEYRGSLSRLKASAKAETVPDWSEGEWQTLAAHFKPAATATRRPALLARPRWAAASVLGVFLGLAVLTMLIKDGNLGQRETSPLSEPSVVSLTLVSQETGLQIVWFLDKNFECKGD